MNFCRELIHELHKRGKEVYLISGGFRSIIIPLAQEMHIPTANVYANRLKFFYDGNKEIIYLFLFIYENEILSIQKLINVVAYYAIILICLLIIIFL